MSADDRSFEVAKRLAGLLKAGVLKGAELDAAERGVRQLVDPLRMLIVGPDPQMAVSLLNLALGERIIPRSMRGVQIQFSRSEEPFADLQFRDGSKKRCSADQFSDILSENPVKIRIGANLPVLSKISIMVIANSNARKLSEEVERIASRSDFAFWVVGDMPSELQELWGDLPNRLRQHSYQVRHPETDVGAWAEIEDEFVDILSVDPEAALTAKSAEGGADKEAFKAAGGMDFVKQVKSEIEMLRKAAMDAADVLLMRHEDVLKDAVPQKIEAKTASSELSAESHKEAAAPSGGDGGSVSTPAESLIGLPKVVGRGDRKTESSADAIEPAVLAPRTEVKPEPKVEQDAFETRSLRPASSVTTRPRSVPAAKVQKSPRVRSRPSKPPMAAEDIQPKRPVRPSRPKSRPRKSRPGETPWSLGL